MSERHLKSGETYRMVEAWGDWPAGTEFTATGQRSWEILSGRPLSYDVEIAGERHTLSASSGAGPLMLEHVQDPDGPAAVSRASREPA